MLLFLLLLLAMFTFHCNWPRPPSNNNKTTWYKCIINNVLLFLSLLLVMFTFHCNCPTKRTIQPIQNYNNVLLLLLWLSLICSCYCCDCHCYWRHPPTNNNQNNPMTITHWLNKITMKLQPQTNLFRPLKHVGVNLTEPSMGLFSFPSYLQGDIFVCLFACHRFG